MAEIEIARRGIVAVVDDDSRMLESLQDLLESDGYEARVFSSAKAFLASGSLYAIGCLICDICMPEMDGWALQRLVTLQRPDLPIILITAHAVSALTVAARCSGRLPPLFKKPFDGQSLLRAIRSLLAGP
jgi:FixJ family two-component response regulator